MNAIDTNISRRSVLAVDGAKFGRGALAVVCELAAVDVVVTDDSAPASAVAAAMRRSTPARCSFRSSRCRSATCPWIR